MTTVWALFRKDLLLFLKDRTAVALSFLVPMALITIFGYVFGGSGSGPSGIRLLVVDEARTELSADLVDLLEAEETFRVISTRVDDAGEEVPLERAGALSLLETNASAFRYALILPADLLEAEFGLNLDFHYNPQNAIENNIVQAILQKTFFSGALPLLFSSGTFGLDEESRSAFNQDLADSIVRNFGGDRDEIRAQLDDNALFSPFGGGESAEGEGGGSGDFLGGIFNIDKVQVFGRDKNPASQSVGGWAVMFLLFSLTGAASSLFEERDKGLFLRLLAGPASRGHILFSKFLFCAFLGLSQMVVLLAFGELVFDIIVSPAQLLPLFAVSLAASAAATAFGMFLASLAKTPAQANGMGTFFILAMSAFGGAMFPLFMMPEFIRSFISPISPVYWAMEGLLGVLWRDASLAGVLLNIAVLALFSALFLSIALVRFRRGDLFR